MEGARIKMAGDQIPKDKQETKELMNIYEKPIYLFIGNKDFDNPCFEIYLQKGDNKILKYIC